MYWAAVFIGLMGSLHCLGMCGPVVLALNHSRPGTLPVVVSSSIYHAGRLTAYAFIGLIFGMAGTAISMFPIQQLLSIATGVLILVWLLSRSNWVTRHSGINISNLYFRITSPLLRSRSGLRRTGGNYSRGLLNGFLPCGLVYLSAIASLNTGSIQGSMLYMLLFGLGTMPMMASVNIARQFIGHDLKRKITRIIPVFAAALAILFILRGLALDIPYVSPANINETIQGGVTGVDCD